MKNYSDANEVCTLPSSDSSSMPLLYQRVLFRAQCMQDKRKQQNEFSKEDNLKDLSKE